MSPFPAVVWAEPGRPHNNGHAPMIRARIDFRDEPCYPTVVRKNEVSGSSIPGEPILAGTKATQRGRLVTQVRLTNFTDPAKTLAVSALVDVGSACITLPTAWRERLGELEELGEVEVEMADQTVKKACVCRPVCVRIGGFRPVLVQRELDNYCCQPSERLAG
jgi:hypothetical protein